MVIINSKYTFIVGILLSSVVILVLLYVLSLMHPNLMGKLGIFQGFHNILNIKSLIKPFVYTGTDMDTNVDTDMNIEKDILNYANLSDGGATPWTIDDASRTVVTHILRQILETINMRINTHYHFMEYEHINTELIYSSDGTQILRKYTVDFFIHDTTLKITKRIIIIFTLNSVSGSVIVQHINVSNAQNEATYTPIDPLYIKHNDLIITNNTNANTNTNANNNKNKSYKINKYFITGINNSELDFSHFVPSSQINLDNNEQTIDTNTTALDINKWILPIGIQSELFNNNLQYPYMPQSMSWDTNGIGINMSDYKNCYCTRDKHTHHYIPFTPHDNPTIVKQSTDKSLSPNSGWMFDATENISGGNRLIGII